MLSVCPTVGVSAARIDGNEAFNTTPKTANNPGKACLRVGIGTPISIWRRLSGVRRQLYKAAGNGGLCGGVLPNSSEVSAKRSRPIPAANQRNRREMACPGPRGDEPPTERTGKRGLISVRLEGEPCVFSRATRVAGAFRVAGPRRGGRDRCVPYRRADRRRADQPQRQSVCPARLASELPNQSTVRRAHRSWANPRRARDPKISLLSPSDPSVSRQIADRYLFFGKISKIDVEM